MTAASPPSHPPSHGAGPDLQHPHEQVLHALDDPAANSLAAVTWGSSHLAAVEKVIYPLARQKLERGRERVRALAAVDHRLQLALWQLDRRLTGDVHLGRLPVPVLEDGVRRGLQAHAQSEAELVADLLPLLSPEELRDLDERMATAVLRGPTRPHPDTRHGRLGGGLAFWFDGVVDRVRDSLDSRSVPTPHRVPARRPVTRWGAYAMGTPLAPPPDEPRPE